MEDLEITELINSINEISSVNDELKYMKENIMQIQTYTSKTLLQSSRKLKTVMSNNLLESMKQMSMGISNNLSESMKQMSIGISNNFSKGIKQINIGILNNLSESMRQMDIEIFDNLSESMEQMSIGISNALSEIMGQISMEVFNNLSESMRQMNMEVLNSLSESMKQINIGISNNTLEIIRQINLYNDTLVNYREVYDNQILRDDEEINLQANELNEILSDNTLSIQERLFKIWERFKNKNIFVILIIWQLIISPILTPIKENYDKFVYKFVSTKVETIIDYVPFKEKKLVNNCIKKDITKELSNNPDFDKKYILNTYRFVNSNVLNVRTKNTVKSRVIYSLNRGSVVRIINKQKNWTKIEYKNEDETVVITGWVFTRYISRFD